MAGSFFLTPLGTTQSWQSATDFRLTGSKDRLGRCLFFQISGNVLTMNPATLSNYHQILFHLKTSDRTWSLSSEQYRFKKTWSSSVPEVCTNGKIQHLVSFLFVSCPKICRHCECDGSETKFSNVNNTSNRPAHFGYSTSHSPLALSLSLFLCVSVCAIP